MSRHLVHFYDDAYPAEEASEFIAAGLMAGDTCIVMLIPPHRQAVERCLETRRMFSTPTGPHTGHYLALDTHEALARLTVDGRLDKAGAEESLGALLSPASHGGRGCVRLVGDPAPVLFAAGRQDDALALEELVGSLSDAHGAAIFCAYPMRDLRREGTLNPLFKLCSAHTAVDFPKQPWIHRFLHPAPVVSDQAP
jgi:MEDS: MEthanogen/methylotroph, DcmR Sensory domain